MITSLDMSVLATLATYYCLCRPQLQLLCFPEHRDSRSLRNRLNKLMRGGFIAKTKCLIPYRGGSTGCPVWYLTSKGAELLVEFYDDEKYLALNTKPPRESILFHWLAIGDTHIAIAKAVAMHTGLSLVRWVNEWEVVNKDALRAGQFYLHSVFQENPPLSCSPDFGLLLGYGGHRIVLYGEEDRNTSGARSIAASKSRGYAELARRNWHRERHFPDTTLDRFRVLMVTTHHGRRKAIQRAMENVERNDLWLFVCKEDLTPENFPFGDVFYDVTGTPGPLVRKRTDDEEAA